MDGPSVGSGGGFGGNVIGSAFVEIGADLSGLRAAEEEVKSMLQRIGAMGGSGSVGNPVNGAQGISGGMIQLKFDENGLRQQLDGFFRSYQVQPIKVPVEFDVRGGPGGTGSRITNQGALSEIFPGVEFGDGARYAPLLSDEGGPPSLADIESLGHPARARIARGGGGIGRGRRYNPFTPYGIGRMVGSIGAAYATNYAIRLGAGLINAEQIEAHPEYLASEYISTSAGDLSGVALPFAASVVGAQANLARYQAFASIPILGNIIGLSGAEQGLQFNVARAQRALSGRVALEESAHRSQLGMAGLFDPYAGALANLDDAHRRNLDSLSQNGIIRVHRGMFRNDYLYEDPSAVAAYQTNEAFLTAQRAKIGVQQQLAGSSLFSEGLARRDEADAINLLASFAPGSQMQAMQLRQAAELTRYRGSAQAMVGNLPASLRGIGQFAADFGEDLLKAGQGLDTAKAKRESESQITQIQAQADAARLRARHDAFSAEEALFKAHAENLKRAVAGTPAEEVANRALATQSQAMNDIHNEAVFNAFSEAGVAFGNAGLSAQAAQLRMNRNPEAALIPFQQRGNALGEQMRQAMSQLNFGNMGTVLPHIIGILGQQMTNAANQGATDFEIRRGRALEDFTLGARSSAAQAVIGNAPRNARAITDVARARLELENADPAERDRLRRTLMLELQAEQHDLIGIHGGEMGINMSLSQAAGSVAGLDLRGIGRDRELASRTISGGINDLAHNRGIPGAQANGNQGMQEAAKLFSKAVADFVRAIAKNGVTMFAAGGV